MQRNVDNIGQGEPESAPKTAKTSDSWLTTALKFGGALTAAAFLVGWLYRAGQLEGMGLPAEVLTYRPQDLLFISYTALVNLSASVLLVQMQHWFRLLMILVAYAALGGAAIALGARSDTGKAVERGFGWIRRQSQDHGMSRAFAVGTAFMFCFVIGIVAGGSLVLASLYLPLQIYEFGKERGARIAAVAGCNAAQAELLTACAEVTFTDDHKIIGVYLAGEVGGLALRVDNQSIIFAQPIKTIRFGSAQRTGP